jgi:photosystem II stability/assembly factor-like uncharacterized protein
MKTLLTLFTAFLFLQFSLFAQEGWFWQNPLPQGNTLFDVSIIDENTAVSVGSAGTILKTTDGGSNWKIKSSQNDLQRLTSVDCIDNYLWVVGWDGVVLKSSDYGENWSYQLTNPDDMINSVYFLDENMGWGVGHDGLIIHTTNGGIDWERESGLWTNEDLYDIQFLNENFGWISGIGVVLNTTNGGTNWESITSAPFSWCSSLYFLNKDSGWVVSSYSLFKTTNGGVDWTEHWLGGMIAYNDILFIDENTGWIAGSGFNGSSGYVSKTTDGGENWTELWISNYLGLHSIEFSNNNIGWTVGCGGIILISTNNGDDWNEQSSRIEGINSITDIFFINENIGWITGGFYVEGELNNKSEGLPTILKSTNGGTDWIPQYYANSLFPTGYLNSIYFTDILNGWAIGSYFADTAKILHTTNGGEDWLEQYNGVSDLNYSSLHFINNNIGWVAGYNGLILRTSNGGIDWNNYLTGTEHELTSIFFTDSLNGWTVGNIWNEDDFRIFSSTDGGATWSTQFNSIYYLTDVFFVDSDNGWVVGFYNDYPNLVGAVLKTTDGGNTWNSEEIESTTGLYSVHYNGSNNGWIAGSKGTILHTSNGGENWIKQNSPYDGRFESVYFINNPTGWVVGGSAIIKTTTGGVSFVEESEIDEMPSDYNLCQNYPNPFNSSSIIRYSVPQSSNVIIKVFDILGNEIETLVNEKKPSGTYELTWYSESLPSGVYFYQLKAGEFVQTKKMILLK